jgi:hypothetical protein
MHAKGADWPSGQRGAVPQAASIRNPLQEQQFARLRAYESTP